MRSMHLLPIECSSFNRSSFVFNRAIRWPASPEVTPYRRGRWRTVSYECSRNIAGGIHLANTSLFIVYSDVSNAFNPNHLDKTLLRTSEGGCPRTLFRYMPAYDFRTDKYCAKESEKYYCTHSLPPAFILR